MADEPDDILDPEDIEGEDPENTDIDDEDQDDPGDDSGGEPEEETVISFGDDEPEPEPDDKADSAVIRQMRAALREKDRELNQLRQQSQPKIEVGEKPTLAGCDYDEEAFEQKLDEWKERKRQTEASQTEAQKQAEAAQEQWGREVQAYQTKKAQLGAPDVDEAEEIVVGALDQIQRAVLIKATDDPARFMYALSKHKGKLAELAKIKDPVKLAAAMAKLEGVMKVVKRRKAPDPEKIASGSAATPGADKQLEKLEKEADRTGDRTKLIAYKKSKGL